ncbi:MAG TPA: glycosyltransferase family 39 protein [Verrucomicrobiae bacterium]|nr:glycosyltransferase family 39 protein [Verrucomicrobiae bacterium]
MYFINAGGVLFDSPEYLHLFTLPNFIQALAGGHHPLHLGYIALFWPIFHAATFFSLNGAISVIVVQILLSGITLCCYYELIHFITDKKTAFLATLFAALVPLYWIITDTIMMENAYLCFFFVSLYFLIRSISDKKHNLFFHILSMVFLLLAAITHTMVIFWLPFLWFLIFYKKRKFLLVYAISSLISIFLAYSLNIYFSAITSNSSWQAVFYALSKEKDDMAILGFTIKSVGVIIRDFFIIQMRNYTFLLTILSLISLLKLFKVNKNLFILGILWILPALYINLWWDSLFPGRYAALSGFGITFLSSLLLKNHKIVTFLVIAYLLIVTVPAVNLLRQPIPYLEEAKYAASLPNDSLLIESHFDRPQVQETFRGKLVSVNDNLLTNEDIQKLINNYLLHKKPVYISSAALSDPYGLYTGPYLHILSLSYAGQPKLWPVMEKYSLKKYKTISNADNLFIYKIISNNPSPYPSVKNLKNSYRRLDYTDPLWQITWYIETNELGKKDNRYKEKE